MVLTRALRRASPLYQFSKHDPAIYTPAATTPSIKPNKNCRGRHSSAITTEATALPPVNPRWLSTTKRRIGKCLTFGLRPDQITEAGEISQQLARDWRELVAGSEGFLTSEARRGMFRHNVVWGEMDVMVRHVNNVMYVRYAETARINWARNFAVYLDPAHKNEWLQLVGSESIGLILRSIKVNYKFPMMWPDKISVYHKLSNEPPSPSSSNPNSFSTLNFDVIILSEKHQRPAARCEEDVVFYDYRIASKVETVPGFMLEQFRRTWELQEEAKRANRLGVQEIDARVKALETASWDREDAVEDMGSAASQ